MLYHPVAASYLALHDLYPVVASPVSRHSPESPIHLLDCASLSKVAEQAKLRHKVQLVLGSTIRYQDPLANAHLHTRAHMHNKAKVT